MKLIYKKEETDSTFYQQDYKSILKQYALEELLFFLVGVKQFDFLLFQTGSVFASIFHTGSFSTYTISAYYHSTIFVYIKSLQLVGYTVMHHVAKYTVKPIQPTYRTTYTTDYERLKRIDI